MPPNRIESVTRACALTYKRTSNLSGHGIMPNQLNYISQNKIVIYPGDQDNETKILTIFLLHSYEVACSESP